MNQPQDTPDEIPRGPSAIFLAGGGSISPPSPFLRPMADFYETTTDEKDERGTVEVSFDKGKD